MRETLDVVKEYLEYAASNGSIPPLEAPSRRSLEEVRGDLGDCRRCKLSGGRKNIVFGEGNPNAELMFVGEGPGADEDVQGRPFVGRAGQLLTKIIEAMSLTRSDVYIANVVKCRPPENRNPEPDEIESCSPFLLRQIAAIRPRIIVSLGKFSAQTLMNTQVPISKLRGVIKPFRIEIDGDPIEIQLMPTYHPAYLLRNPSEKRVVWEDMKRVMQLLTSR